LLVNLPPKDFGALNSFGEVLDTKFKFNQKGADMADNIKGYSFEYFVLELLKKCGFAPVNSDDELIFDGSAGQMIHGLGQCHNADVLVEPPFQTPFYYPTRLLVECKCYESKVGLPTIRNVLGLREDINNFDIVTKEILENRRSGRTTKPHFYPMQRHLYQVAVASLTEYKYTALTHEEAQRIPLISLAESQILQPVRNEISRLDEVRDINGRQKLISLFKGQNPNVYINNPTDVGTSFIEEVQKLANVISVGLMENGTIIFLVDATHYETNVTQGQYNDGFTLHWADDKKTWLIRDDESAYFFELPKELFDEWKLCTDDWQNEQVTRYQALGIKARYFSKIMIFNRITQDNPYVIPKTINISKMFIDDAYNLINE